jgi:hypothetical protein
MQLGSTFTVSPRDLALQIHCPSLRCGVVGVDAGLAADRVAGRLVRTGIAGRPVPVEQEARRCGMPKLVARQLA